MNILGIHDGHNATVALFEDGRVTYAVSEERLTRVKNQGGFPGRALDRILHETGLAPSAVDRVIFTTRQTHAAEWHNRELLLLRYREIMTLPKTKSAYPRRVFAHALQWLRRFAARRQAFDAHRFQPFFDRGFLPEQISVMDHHRAHAASAYYSAHDFDRPVLCLTNDGGGDGLCATVSVGKNGCMERIATIPVRNSFAALYARATFLLGMMPLEHEYKLMGLAPYADEKKAERFAEELLSYFTWPSHEPLAWRLAPRFANANIAGAALRDLFAFVRFDIVAAAMQLFIERMALTWVRNCIRETGIGRLALAGGLFMNVKLNKRILELPEVESVFLMPSSGDESTPFGACYDGAIEAGMEPSAFAPLRDLYLGPRYSDSDLEQAIAAARGMHGVVVARPEALADAVAALLAQGAVVAIWQGREEFGARALGNRSILADPSRWEAVRELNLMIKSRDFWMPFAGSMTDKQAKGVLDNPKQHHAPYMMMTFCVQNHFDDMRAATHPYDETIRPQVVDKSWNPSYYRLIELFEQKSGKKGGILNTSFNLHGYPIVSSPQDALDVFLRSGLRYLAMGPYLLRKS